MTRAPLVLAAVAWLWMIAQAITAHRLTCCSPWPSVGDDALGWIAMVCAMMLPTTLPAVRDVSHRTFRALRRRAIVAYLAGYLAPWLATGVAVVALRRFAIMHAPWAAPVLFGAAAAYATTHMRERIWLRCHRQVPLWRAGRDGFRQGLAHGIPCIALCAPAMLACTLTGHDLAVMLGGTVLALVDKRAFQYERRPLVIGSLALALVALR